MDRGGDGISMERVLAILEALIAFPTVSSQSNLALIAWVEALLADAGFTVTRFYEANRDYFDAILF